MEHTLEMLEIELRQREPNLRAVFFTSVAGALLIAAPFAVFLLL